MGSALVQHSLGHAQQSQQALDQSIRDSAQFAAYQIAEIYAWRGERDQAFHWLERACTQRDRAPDRNQERSVAGVTAH